jgi:hypothetical protein
MAKRILIGIGVLLSAVVFLFVGIVAATLIWGTSTGVGATLPSGRSVTASTKSWFVGLETSGNTAIVRTSRRTVLIEPTKVVVDGRLFGSIPAGARAINVDMNSDEIVITADGAAIARRPQ